MLGDLSPSVDCSGKTLWLNKADWHLLVGREDLLIVIASHSRT